jgi:FKBP-type peptidyl-prolyl cis-trans isomerase
MAIMGADDAIGPRASLATSHPSLTYLSSDKACQSGRVNALEGYSMSTRTLGLGALLVVVSAMTGCEGPESLVPSAPPGIDARSALAAKKEPDDKAPQALGEQIAASGAGPTRQVLVDTPPALPTKLGEVKTTPSGVKYETIKEGAGAVAKAGQRVRVAYTGTLEDGRKFDGTKAGETRPFTIGVPGDMITGWNEAVPGMKIGERRKLIVPPNAAYRAQGKEGVIPPNATLLFEIELIGID